MRKVIGITIAVFMLAGSLVGCGNSDTEKSKTATVTSIETQAEQKKQWKQQQERIPKTVGAAQLPIWEQIPGILQSCGVECP